MSRRLRLLLAALLAALTLVAGAHPAAAQDSGSSGSDSTAIAVNTKDGSSLFRFAFSITKATGEVVDAGNAAVSYASCTACQTVSIAIQFVIVEGSPDTFTPENLAMAFNQSCSLCDTMATAYQFVIQTTGPVRLTSDGRRQLNDLIKQIRDLEDAGLTGPDIAARVDAIASQMYEVMLTSLVPVADAAAAATDASAIPSTTTTTVSHDTATTTSTTEVVHSTTTTTTRPASSTSSTSSTTSAPSTTTTTSAPSTTTTTPAP
ncbi:MAG TPA: hypothetical protein VM143_13005 [Acidimicrobiales bacterium]|nr:hypothetical protein [Acidimicrobiales bacterium]